MSAPVSLLDPVAEVTIRRPQDFFAARLEVLDDRQRDAARDHPIRQRLHARGRVRIHDDGAIRVRFAERFEFIGRTTDVERALRLECRHQHALLGRKDLGRFAHEPDARDDERRRRVTLPKRAISSESATQPPGFLGEILDVAVDVVVRDDRRVLFRQQSFDVGFERELVRIAEHDGCVQRNLLGAQPMVGHVHEAEKLNTPRPSPFPQRFR